MDPRNTNFRALVFLLFLAPSLFAGVIDRCAFIRREISGRSPSGRSAQNNRRNVNQYVAELGERFVEDVNALPYESHFLDAGAGASVALWQMVEGRQVGLHYVHLKSRGITAIDPNRPSSMDIGLLYGARDRQFRYLDKKIESVTHEQVGTCDMIVDVHAPFSYSERPDQVLRTYLDLLKVGGKLYIAYDRARTKINGSTEGIQEYLHSIPGIRAELLQGGKVIRIEKTGWTEARLVPELKEDKFETGLPPYRDYSWVPPAP